MQGWVKGANGEDMLKASVTAAPDKGKANKALIELLAEYLGVAKSTITIVRGETDRLKTLEIEGLNTPFPKDKN
ncbi:MAG: DUF167 domain-containing protein [Alphaproteobacteria bacterium]